MAVCLSLMVCGAGTAHAHKGSDAYLDVRQLPAAAAAAGATAQAGPSDDYRFVLSVALRDLDQVVAVDADGDARITWGEVKAATPQLLAQLDGAVTIADGSRTSDGQADTGAPVGAPQCVLRWQADGLERRSDGAYFRAAATARCLRTAALELRYTLFREQDANHRLLIAGRIEGADLLSTASPQQQGAVRLREGHAAVASTSTGRLPALRAYFLLGMHHLLLGYDHLAFLLALVLPLRLRLRWRGAAGDRNAAASGAAGNWLALLHTVTAFTVGHSITLIFATLGWTQASATWVEPVIALSIVFTAALNLRPLPWLRTEVMALGFGMVHGYGFAGLLQEAAAPDGLLPWALAGFNLGVEGGQLVAVAAWVLVVQAVVARKWYPRVVVQGGSVLLIGLATVWFWRRVA